MARSRTIAWHGTRTVDLALPNTGVSDVTTAVFGVIAAPNEKLANGFAFFSSGLALVLLSLSAASLWLLSSAAVALTSGCLLKVKPPKRAPPAGFVGSDSPNSDGLSAGAGEALWAPAHSAEHV